MPNHTLKRNNNSYNPAFNISINKEIYYLEGSVTTGINNKTVKTFPLVNEYIGEWSFTSDLLFPMIKGSITYRDIGNFTFSEVNADGTSIINLTFKKNIKNNSVQQQSVSFSEDIKLEHKFILLNKNIIDITNDTTTYELTIISVDWYAYNNYLSYSSGGNKNLIDILIDLYSKANLTLNTRNVTGIDKGQFFITGTNYHLLDSINYIFSTSINKTSGPFFIVYDFNKDEYVLHNLKQQWANTKDPEIKNFNVFNLSTKFNSPIRNASQYYTISDFKEINFEGADKNIERTKEFQFKKFDHINREWSTEQISTRDLINSLPDPQKWAKYNKQIGTVKQEFIGTGALNAVRVRPPESTTPYNTDITKMFMYTNVVEFKVFGNLQRKAGEFCFIGFNEGDALFKQYVGLWYILRVDHVFKGDQYYTIINASRVDRKEGITYFENPKRGNKLS